MQLSTCKEILSLITILCLFQGCCAIFNKNCDDDDSGPAIAILAGEYFTAAEGLTQRFSPLEITPEGEVFISGEEIDYDYNSERRVMTIAPQTINNNTVTGEITFELHESNIWFSGTISPRIQDEAVVYWGSQKPQAIWAGTYECQTQSWSAYHSPLIIHKNGTITMDQNELIFDFDQTSHQLVFPSQVYKEHRIVGEINFKGDWDAFRFTGRMRPRSQDGYVGYEGTLIE